MKKFTFIAEFKNGTYISQYKADNLMEAVLIWADNLDVQFFTNKVKTKIQEKVRDSSHELDNHIKRPEVQKALKDGKGYDLRRISETTGNRQYIRFL